MRRLLSSCIPLVMLVHATVYFVIEHFKIQASIWSNSDKETANKNVVRQIYSFMIETILLNAFEFLDEILVLSAVVWFLFWAVQTRRYHLVALVVLLFTGLRMRVKSALKEALENEAERRVSLDADDIGL